MAIRSTATAALDASGGFELRCAWLGQLQAAGRLASQQRASHWHSLKPLEWLCPSSLLFLLFLAINVAWECLLGLLRFLDDFTGRRGTLWISRVKEEILGLVCMHVVCTSPCKK